MTDHTRPTADEARRSLDEASGISVVTGRDLRVLQRVLVGIGAAMAAVLLFVRALGDHPWGLAVAMGLYVVAILLLLRWQRTVTAAPRGYGSRYGMGIAGTSAMYGLGIALIAGQNPSWSLTALLALLTVAPAVLAARSIARLGHHR
ncbi:hypothetical protein [Mobilicoccus massiliensis]|uniref:hypothetical protein n=1 Tax=Mobilicoccus massiliensis TaxID=1522310 RepID=UPI00058DFDD9|nr:hypothetical protein [Mobilicoccus massiliensis]